jgi:hypothetical protein
VDQYEIEGNGSVRLFSRIDVDDYLVRTVRDQLTSCSKDFSTLDIRKQSSEKMDVFSTGGEDTLFLVGVDVGNLGSLKSHPP